LSRSFECSWCALVCILVFLPPPREEQTPDRELLWFACQNEKTCGADLQRCDLQHCVLQHCDLQHCDLQHFVGLSSAFNFNIDRSNIWYGHHFDFEVVLTDAVDFGERQPGLRGSSPHFVVWDRFLQVFRG
jgi:hypothetical protein